MRFLRVLVIAFVVLAAALFAAAFSIRWYASTQIVPALAELYGGRVEAERTSVGWTRVDLQGVSFYEADGQTVLARVGQMSMDLTLLDLLRGKSIPEHLRLEQSELHLRFDAN